MIGQVATFLVSFLGIAGAPSLPETIEPCLRLGQSEQRIACVAEADLPPLPPQGLSTAKPFSNSIPDPDLTRALFERIERADRIEDWETSARAAWLLAESGAGIQGLRWVGTSGDPIWTAVIGDGSRQLARLARSMRLAKRDDLAERMLRRALELGQPIDPSDGWDAATIERLTPAVDPVMSETWFLPLKSVTLEVIDGEPINTDDLRGSVVVFDFWAGWCEPCLEELPLMQAFQDENRERGLRTFAVNVDEPRATARASAESMGLELPIVEYTPELRETFGVTQLPTVVLVDRLGRVRGRWELFKDGTEESIFWAIGEILDLEGVEAETIARRLVGERQFQVRWMREFRAKMEGVATVQLKDGDARVIVTHGRTLLVLMADGRTERKLSGSLTAGRLVTTRPDLDDRFTVLSYRLGGTAVSRFNFPAQASSTWDAPAPVFDLQLIDPHDPETPVAVGTLDGIVEFDPDGQPVRSADVGLVRGLVRHPEASGAVAGPAWLALTGRDEPRGWLTLAADLSTLSNLQLPQAPWRVQSGAADGGFALMPSSVKATAAGRFFAGLDQDQLAVAGNDQLVILAIESGAELYRSSWKGIGDLAAGDLDGDGLDELVVVWGQRLAVLSESEDEVTPKNGKKSKID